MKYQLLKALLQKHLDFLKGFPLHEIKRLDESLHAELLAASRGVDFAYFHEDGNKLIAAISAAEKQYIAAWQKHFGDDEAAEKYFNCEKEK